MGASVAAATCGWPPAGGERPAVQALRHVHAAPDQALRDRELRASDHPRSPLYY